jgi:ABC-type dipeptide/oligopeptide/nickel transport system permease component
MWAYILRRVLATIPVMAVVALFVFSLLYLAPGDPAAIIAGDQATPQDVERIRASLGWTGPIWCASAPGCGTSCAGTSAPPSSPTCPSAA